MTVQHKVTSRGDESGAAGVRLRAIVAEVDVLLNTTDRDALLRHAVEFIRDGLGVERCGLFLYDGRLDRLQGTYGTDGQGRTRDERSRWIDRNETWPHLKEVASPQRTQHWLVETYPPRPPDDGSPEPLWREWCATTPLVAAGGRLIGVVFNDTALTHAPLDDEQQELLAVYCSLLANILERHQAHEALAVTVRRARAILDEATQLLAAGDRDDLLRHTVEFVRRELGLDRCRMFLLNETTGMLEGTFSSDESGAIADERVLRLDRSLWPWAEWQSQIEAGSQHWFVLEGKRIHRRGDGLHVVSGSGWLVATPIALAGAKMIGVMFNERVTGAAAPDPTQQDQLAMFCSLVGNLLERKRAEQGLEWERTLLRTLIDHLPDPIYVKDAQHRFVYVNRASVAVVGHNDPASLVGRGDEDFYRPEMAAAYRADEEAILRTGLALVNKEETVVDAQGRAHILLTTKVPLKDAQSRITGMVGIGRDITEHKAAEEERRRIEMQMQHVQKLESLGVLAGGIAHDFNNLLAVILGNADLARAEMGPEAPGRDCLDTIVTVSRKAADLCRNMLAYSGKGRFVVEPLDLSRLVEETTHMLEVSVSKKAALRYRLATDLPHIRADATQIRQVVMNLIMNAAEAITQPGGAISISTGVVTCDRTFLAGAYLGEDLPEGRYVCLEVADSGCGMDGATLARVFDPFFTTKFAGRGLGLAVVLGIVRGHHGTIKIRSEQGRGTTFEVLLPVGDEQSEERSRPEANGPGQSPMTGTILVVDDEEDVRSVTCRMLKQGGLKVITAADGHEAVARYREHAGSISGVLLDLTMPRCGGEETYQRLVAIDPNVRVVLTSGYNEQDVTQRFAGKGLAGFVQKPFQINDLLAAVQAIVRPEVS